MKKTQFYLPTKIEFGSNILESSLKHVKDYGERCLIVIGKGSVKKNSILDKVLNTLKELSIQSFLFEGIETNPSYQVIDQAAEYIRKVPVDFVIGLGGGSVMDSAKCIAMLAVNGGSIWDFVKHNKLKEIKGSKPCICIPTIMATGSEANARAVINNPDIKEKSSVFHTFLIPKLAIIDPALSITVQPQLFAEGVIDTFCHVLDPYLSTSETSTIHNRLSESILKTIIELLPFAISQPDNLIIREQLAWCATLSLSGILDGLNGSYPIHYIEHSLSGHFSIRHGNGIAALLIPKMNFDTETHPERIAQLNRVLFNQNLSCNNITEQAKYCINSLEYWIKKTRISSRLSNYKISPSLMEKLAEDTLRINSVDGTYLKNIRPIDKRGIIQILEMLLQ